MTRRTRCAVAGGLLGLGAAARSVMRKSVFNRRTAPTLYRGVVGITREHDGSCALGGIGTPVDWLVEMNRFPQEACSTGLASAGHLDLELMSPLAAASADFHTSAERRADHGGKPGMSWVIEGNATGCAEFGKRV